MKRGWIIRGFFTGLLLLCVAGWAWSYGYKAQITHSDGPDRIAAQNDEWIPNNTYLLICQGGRISLLWSQYGTSPPMPIGWKVDAVPATGSPASHSNDLLGFFMKNERTLFVMVVPLWFPTVISALCLWFAWRKTRPPVNGRAFPVEVGKLTVVQRRLGLS